MKSLIITSLALAAMVVSGSTTDDLEAELRVLRSEVKELHTIITAFRDRTKGDATYSDDSPPEEAPSEAAPERRRLTASGDTASVSWDGESLNIQSRAADKKLTMAILGTLNVTGDIYLGGTFISPVPAPAVPTSAPTTSAPTALAARTFSYTLLTSAACGCNYGAGACEALALSLGLTYEGITTAAASGVPAGCYLFETNGKLYWNDFGEASCTSTRTCYCDDTC